jgi:hypothetical protein
MNVFATYECPIKSAKYLDLKRRNKMILETAQMTCTAIYEHAPELFHKAEYSPIKFVKKKLVKPKRTKYAYYINRQRMYAPTHKNHPSNVWLRQTKSNFKWAIQHAKELNNLIKNDHKSMEIIKLCENYCDIIPEGKLTPFANCAANKEKGVSYKHLKDTHLAYRKYLRDRWQNDKIKPKWH